MPEGSAYSPATIAGMAFAIVLVLLCDLAVVGVHILDDKTSLVTGRSPAPTEPEVRPGPGQAFVTGEIDTLSADKAQTSTLRAPFTIDGERGVSNLTIENATVGGRRVTISWNGGTPLPVSGDGGLELGATRVTVDEDGVTWSLDGGPRSFVAGTYSISAPVGVGAAGLATPREGVDFTADEQTVLVSRGGAVIRLDPGKVELRGPGTLEVQGSLQVAYPDRKSRTGAVRFGEGPFQATVEPNGDKLRLSAVLQGDVTEG